MVQVDVSILGNWVDLFLCLQLAHRRKRELTEAARSVHRIRKKGCRPDLVALKSPIKVISPISGCAVGWLSTHSSEWLPFALPGNAENNLAMWLFIPTS